MKRILGVISIIMLLIVSGCSDQGTSSGNVEFIITQNFGDEIIAQKNIGIMEGESVIDLMDKEFEIETAYGGGFVDSINGIKSGYTKKDSKIKMDWFYYVNGYLSEIGAGDYEVNNGDVVIWDYHDWESVIFNQSIIGAYPDTFSKGYMGEKGDVEIIGSEGYRVDMEKLKDYLNSEGVGSININSIEENDMANTEMHTLLIGEWEEIKYNEIIKKIVKNRKKTGLFFTIDDSIQGLDSKGKPVDSMGFDKGAVITPVLKGYGDIGTLWIITGNDEIEIKRALKILYEEPEKIKGRFSVIVSNDEVYSLPVNTK